VATVGLGSVYRPSLLFNLELEKVILLYPFLKRVFVYYVPTVIYIVLNYPGNFLKGLLPPRPAGTDFKSRIALKQQS
jgi:hypothetical protein